MKAEFAEYLAYSRTGRIEYLKFIIELADIAIRNRDNPEIKPETLEKAYRAKERATKELEEERSRQREQRKRNDRGL
jgi:flagellar motor component MotA